MIESLAAKLDRLHHDAERAEAGAAFAAQMHDEPNARSLLAKAKRLRNEALELQGIRLDKPAKRDKAKPAAERVERLMLESLSDPAQRAWTVVQRCAHLGIARSWWYEKLEDPLFAARARRVYRSLCDEQLAPVLDVLAKSALLLGREGHPDRKLFLELLGEYTPGQHVDVDVKKPGERMSDDELLAAFEGRMHLLPPGVLRRMGMDPDAVKPDEKAA